ncbi:MAG TPA: DUF2892 domain-containing protein [Xanthomonadales bacterium]|nr:DUF2892 domain-containing protein [Xanthomonadales bacterium]
MNSPYATSPTTPIRATPSTSVEQWVFRLAGLFILVSLGLSQLHSIYWLWFTAFVGANMIQASFTGFCPLAMILKRFGVTPGAAFASRGSAAG